MFIYWIDTTQLLPLSILLTCPVLHSIFSGQMLQFLWSDDKEGLKGIDKNVLQYEQQ